MFYPRLNLIQLFRGLAAVLVVFAHGDLIFNQNLNQDFLFKIFNFGGSGVDFFFVLSGFLIFYIHHDEIGKKHRIKSFLWKRFTRIYPLYWIILAGKIFAAGFLNYNLNTNKMTSSELIKAVLLFPQDRNILSTKFLGVSWTLSFEVLFYIFFGLCIWLNFKFWLPLITIWVGGTLLKFLGIIELSNSKLYLNFVFNPHNLEFILGCLSAYILIKYRPKYGMQLFCLGLFMYTLSAINYYYELINYSSIASFGVASTLLVIGASSLEFTQQIQVPRLLLSIGNASYSIYLSHGFFINNLTIFLKKLQPEIFKNMFYLNLLGIWIVLIAIFCGYLVYLYIEKPLVSIFKLKVATT